MQGGGQSVENTDQKGYWFEPQCRHVLIVRQGARTPLEGFQDTLEQGTAPTNGWIGPIKSINNLLKE